MADSYQHGKRQLLKAAAALPLQAVALGAPRLVGLTGLFAGTTGLPQSPNQDSGALCRGRGDRCCSTGHRD